MNEYLSGSTVEKASSRHQAVAALEKVFGLQIPRSTEPVMLRRFLDVAARTQFEKVDAKVRKLLEAVGVHPPEPDKDGNLDCYGVMHERNNRTCISCGVREACAVETANYGLDTVVLGPKLVGARGVARMPHLTGDLPGQGGTPMDEMAPMDKFEDQLRSYLDENFEGTRQASGLFYAHKELPGGAPTTHLFKLFRQQGRLTVSFLNPHPDLAPKLFQDGLAFRPPKDAGIAQVLDLVNDCARLSLLEARAPSAPTGVPAPPGPDDAPKMPECQPLAASRPRGGRARRTSAMRTGMPHIEVGGDNVHGFPVSRVLTNKQPDGVALNTAETPEGTTERMRSNMTTNTQTPPKVQPNKNQRHTSPRTEPAGVKSPPPAATESTAAADSQTFPIPPPSTPLPTAAATTKKHAAGYAHPALPQVPTQPVVQPSANVPASGAQSPATPGEAAIPIREDDDVPQSPTSSAKVGGKTTQMPKGTESTATGTAAIGPEELKALDLDGLASLPVDSGAAIAALRQDDERDAVSDAGSFERGVRRAVRMRLAHDKKLHHADGMPWKQWAAKIFRCAYETVNRYRIAADIQLQLIRLKLPLVNSLNQARAMAPFRKAERFREVLSKMVTNGAYPAADEIKTALQKELIGGKRAADPRARFCRGLTRLVKSVDPKDREVLAEALKHVDAALKALGEKPS